VGLVTFKGFGGARLEAEIAGADEDPAVVLVHGPGQGGATWGKVAEGLAQAGRRVIGLTMRRQGALQDHIEDLRAVLAQLGSRPVVVAAASGGAIAVHALSADTADLVAGLVLVDPAEEAGGLPIGPAAPGLGLPTLVVQGGLSAAETTPATRAFAAALPAGETAEVADLLVASDRSEAFLGLLLDFLERKQPRSGSEFRGGSDARTLRDAMGCFATGITIVTTIEDGRPIGLTANSFTSVSLEPPLLLVCIARTASSGRVLREAEHFGVNVLQIGQQPASSRFAGKGEDRFRATAWAPGETGVPLLDGSLVSFECKRHAVHEGGDHFILVGEVVRAQFEPRRDPLLYFRGKYRRLHFA
jgi:flavin reductase (DIM6/NTAB) family NADH-FMN oxidoreductase RutF